MKRKQIFLILLLAIIHFGLLYLMLSGASSFLYNDATHRIGSGTDFYAYYNAGRSWLEDGTIYDKGPGSGYRYHPAAAMTLFALLSKLDYDAAYWLWVFIIELMVMVTLFFLYRLISNWKKFFPLLFLLIFFSPLYLDIFMGNGNFLAASVLFIACYYYLKKNKLLFTILFLVSILLKPIGLLLLPFLLLQKEWRIFTTVIVSLVGLAMPYFILNPSDWNLFYSINISTSGAAGFLVHGGNQGFYALLVRIGAAVKGIPLTQLSSTDQLGGFIAWGLKLFPLVLIAGAAYLSIKFKERLELWGMFFIWMSVYMLGYKDVWEHNYALAYFMIVALYLSRLIKLKLLAVIAIALALPTLFAIYDMELPSGRFYDPDWFWSAEVSIGHHLSKPIWLLIAVGAVIANLFNLNKNRSAIEH